MGTLTGTRGTTTCSTGGYGEATDLKVAYGSYTLAVNPTIADIIRFCKVPANAIVLGGYLQMADIDAATGEDSEAFDLDVGWLANGVEAVDADGFGNFGVATGDAITGIKPEVGTYRPLGGVLFTTGPQKFSAETVITGTANAAATTTGTGIITVVVYYVIEP